MFTITLIINTILTIYPLMYSAPTAEDDVVFMTTTPIIIREDNQSQKTD